MNNLANENQLEFRPGDSYINHLLSIAREINLSFVVD